MSHFKDESKCLYPDKCDTLYVDHGRELSTADTYMSFKTHRYLLSATSDLL